MNCQQANQIDMVEYLATLGFKPEKVHQNDYWYLSPNHTERTASFKVNRSKNIWFDHGTGEGGNLVDFAMRFFNCGLPEALNKIDSGGIRNSPPIFQRPVSSLIDTANSIQIIRIDQSITDMFLLRYLNRRQIDKLVAAKFCKQVLYENAGKRFTGIGFKNNCGGYELRSEKFKGSSAPKYVTWFNNLADNITVFEGFFDFLTWRSMLTPQLVNPTNILVLNSLSFFTRSLLLQEKYQRIHLYLDNDNAGRKCIQEIQKRNPGKVVDESRTYKDFKDLNDWHVSNNKSQHIKQSRGIGR
jgi:hypothetical protein